jgi:hypothetical protein
VEQALKSFEKLGGCVPEVGSFAASFFFLTHRTAAIINAPTHLSFRFSQSPAGVRTRKGCVITNWNPLSTILNDICGQEASSDDC